MSLTQDLTPQVQAVALVDQWLNLFKEAVRYAETSKFSELFEPDAVWRDLVSITGTIGKHSGADQIAEHFLGSRSTIRPDSINISTTYSAPTLVPVFGRDVVQAFVEFDTAEGHSVAVVRLSTDSSVPRAWLLLTALRGLHAGGKSITSSFGRRYGYEPRSSTENWRDYRTRRQAFEDRQPEVLVVGGGHNGAIIAAQLEHLGVDTLLIERLPRIGDVWRNRYHPLALHMLTETSHFPLLRFPDTFPDYLSKDQFGDWIETYAHTLEINAWTSTALVAAEYDTETQAWAVTVDRDGRQQTLRPKHIVMATGFIGNIPRIPVLPGIDEFAGQVVHTAHLRDGSELAGKRVLIVGAGTSAHDVAVELTRHGATPTMLQRGAVDIVRLETMEKRHRAVYTPGANLDEIDLLFAASLVFPHLSDQLRADRQSMLAEDGELLDRLEGVGFCVDRGPDGPWLAALRNGQGYYIDVGASELVADGTISVAQSSNLDRFTTNGILWSSGESEEFDAVVLATGFHNSITDVAKYFGEDIAEALGDIHILDDEAEGEWSNAWVPTAQPGLWFTSAGPTITRTYSNYLAMQLCLDLRSVQEEHVPSIPVESAPNSAPSEKQR